MNRGGMRLRTRARIAHATPSWPSPRVRKIAVLWVAAPCVATPTASAVTVSATAARPRLTVNRGVNTD